MLHAAAQDKPYACFVREDSKISFMAMPDAIKSLLMLVDVPREKLKNQVYNIAAFAITAGEFRDRYRCFVVDEYQDVTPLQQRVLDAWLGNRDDLTVVGDANQTIYSFTGASPRHLLDFSRRFPDACVVRLERDYRSTPQVVSLANRVIAAARGRMAGSKLHLIGQRPPGPGGGNRPCALAAALQRRGTSPRHAGRGGRARSVAWRWPVAGLFRRQAFRQGCRRLGAA
jgi:superfamily I DNA/RNA helicase